MTVYCIDNKIIAPLKCGTRYLRSLNLPFDIIHLKDGYWEKSYEIDWQFIVLRTPIEHLKSALQTELLNLYNGHKLWEGMTTKSVLDRFLTKDGCDHWSSSMYKKLYDLWIYKNKSIKIIDLKDLSYFISKIGNYIPYDKQKFDFTNRSVWYSKDALFEMIKTNYSEEYNQLISLMESDAIYYHKFDIEVINKKII